MSHNRIKSKRLELGMTQAQVSEKLGYTQQHYAAIESGVRRLTVETVGVLADLFDTTIDWLLGRKN